VIIHSNNVLDLPLSLCLSSQFKRDKFKNVVHYICWVCEDPRILGPERLNLILWYADRNEVLLRGEALTATSYVRQQTGPVAKSMGAVLRELEREGTIARRERSRGIDMEQYFAIRPPEIELFSASQVSSLEAIVRSVCFEVRSSIPYQAAHDKVWRMAQIGESLPYCTVFACRTTQLLPTDLSWAKRQAQDGNIADGRSEVESMRQVNARLNDALEGLIWHLCHEPSAGISLPIDDSSWFVYKQRGNSIFELPDITALYRFDLDELIITDIKLSSEQQDIDENEE
jgi:hypothetical protein